jgi:arylsulfatase A-like enzyme/Flp pilus assembly protein TadD
MSPNPARVRLAQVFSVLAFAAVLALLGLLAWRLTPPDGPPRQRPLLASRREALPEDASLVLITVDGLRADRLASYGEAPLSPARHLDRLAGEGYRFEQAIAPAPLSFPAHVAVMTGMAPAGREDLLDPAGSLPPGRATLAEVLRSSGFRTAAFVGSAAVGRASGMARGFDRFDEPGVAERPATIRWLADRPAADVAEAARTWLDDNFRARFFLWVELADPEPPYPVVTERGARRRDPYDLEVEAADAAVGRLLARLSSLGVMGHTIVVVAGSHGEALGDHGESGAGIGLYDATLRVPLLFRLPGGPERDRSIPEQVRLEDVMPTLLDLLRLTAPEPPDGVSLVPLLDPGGTLLPLPVVAEAPAGSTWLGAAPRRALRSDGWKWIEGGVEELYDLRRDPGETRNLVTSQPARAREMRAALAALWPKGAAAPESAGSGGAAVAPATPAASRERLLSEALAALRLADGPRARTALEELRRVVIADRVPAPPALLALLGGALRLQGRAPEALVVYEEALESLRGSAGHDASSTGEPAPSPAAGQGSATPGGAGADAVAAAERPASSAGGVNGAAPDAGAPAARTAPLEALLLSDIAACRRLAGQADLAAVAYRAAVRERPDDPWDRLALADVLVETGNPGEAIDELRAALQRAPGEADLLASLGRAYLAAGQAGAALLPLQDALRAAPGMTRPWFDLGRAYEELGRTSDALRAYQDFTARVPAPGDPLYQQAADRLKALRGGA